MAIDLGAKAGYSANPDCLRNGASLRVITKHPQTAEDGVCLVNWLMKQLLMVEFGSPAVGTFCMQVPGVLGVHAAEGRPNGATTKYVRQCKHGLDDAYPNRQARQKRRGGNTLGL